MIALAVIIALSGGIYGATLLTTPTQKPVEAQKTIEPITVARLHKLVNQERVNRGVAPLTLDERLNVSACQKATWINEVDKITHNGYESYIDNYFPNSDTIGENMAQTDETTSSIVYSWMRSQAHADNVLNKSYEAVGYCVSTLDFVAYGKPNLVLVIQHFASTTR
jgi:uncharacterized protein YkwD